MNDEIREGAMRYAWMIANHPWMNSKAAWVCLGNNWCGFSARSVPLDGVIAGLSMCGCRVTCILLGMFRTENGT